ncbi:MULTISPECIES: ectoine/hydroxyectoine ABC transporter substrate-binding protein EhuB [Mesorhizobium]|uniref:Polar amino acid transport system substrate-binding protein n=1 Tax=Mesorhizobium muleiense TaxID=1004279 RepID=A0A1G9F256_9HYPH|nr:MULTISPECIES: ectoine/hydroxyectoine ABC transporter substrate-binding protein EhuB [Mesorhizobium]MCF6098488.1 ectoine/hydroxyectoine ABC transporter substrate-binding protein EhuB [Mesorhizobium muleiense]RUV32391.1 ectoine/hydroxyectoine ABC transporter substrate-binding protein EhuB [Mesorhizobium sp. M5C.F.Ca.IN.020.32.2.1]RWI50724.1 MAG: ectoine/hydroxyectoine ABC transporter substrate-binding protein EhuB [Mesorhizobium sp.]RWP12740.1 MAG: ectoine/hydroxyectoine ABC transporter substr
MNRKLANIVAALGFAIAGATAQAHAGELADRITSGKSIRIGFANEDPYAFPDSNNQPVGFVNAIALGVLKQMGYDNIETVVTDWGGLIPGLQSGRFDMATGGLYILKSRCESVTFSEPLAKVTDSLIVKAGNPKGLTNYEDIATKGAMMVTGIGYSNIEQAKKAGVPDSQIMQVPGQTEILAAVESGRADAGATGYLLSRSVAGKSGGKLEATDPDAMPGSTQNWVSIAFRGSDKDFVEKFNDAQKKYIGTPEMMKAVEAYGYDAKLLPGDKTAEWVCANR